jgi:hypothetical protein
MRLFVLCCRECGALWLARRCTIYLRSIQWDCLFYVAGSAELCGWSGDAQQEPAGQHCGEPLAGQAGILRIQPRKSGKREIQILAGNQIWRKYCITNFWRKISFSKLWHCFRRHIRTCEWHTYIIITSVHCTCTCRGIVRYIMRFVC